MSGNKLAKLIKGRPASMLYPRAFFIADCGVPVVFFKGFEESLVQIMRKIQDEIPEIKRIDPAKKWPKVTLGALRDNKILTLTEAGRLLEVCQKFNEHFTHDFPPVKIQDLRVVLFACRSLERRLYEGPVSLSTTEESDLANSDSVKTVEELLDRFTKKNLTQYWTEYLLKEGERESHYRCYHIESTLICEIPKDHKLSEIIAKFISEIDDVVPHVYQWFDSDSRHLTLLPLVAR